MMVIHQSVIDLDERRSLLIDELNYFAITQDDHFDQESHETLLQEVDVELEQLNNTLQQLKETNNLENDAGHCQLSIDVTLKSLGVERQAYFGGCIIGNHCHSLLKDNNVSVLCASIPQIILEKVGNTVLYEEALARSQLFVSLFCKYGRCHQVFNSAAGLSEDDIENLESDTDDLMYFIRMHFPEIRISPKLHMLEDHIIPFLKKWQVGCGFYGEQGGESIHKAINSMKKNYSNIKCDD